MGLRVPDDVSVVGSDDVSFAKSMYPALTTVRSDLDALGSMAGKLVLESTDDVGFGTASIDLMPTLVSRDTVKRIK
jgi:LacI family transcriptional regulator